MDYLLKNVLLPYLMSAYRQQKCEKSQKFSAENRLPILKNVLLPKTKGFHACLETLANSLDAGIISLLGIL